ncbi:MAG: four helix bundle protein [Balneola sp.]
MNNGPIYKKSFQFSLEIIELYRLLLEEKEFVLSKQLLRSATSIGANVNEASAAESKKDFIHKMAISLKEARETHYWLSLLKESHFIEKDLNRELNACTELIKILTAIIKTSRNRLN